MRTKIIMANIGNILSAICTELQTSNIAVQVDGCGHPIFTDGTVCSHLRSPRHALDAEVVIPAKGTLNYLCAILASMGKELMVGSIVRLRS